MLHLKKVSAVIFCKEMNMWHIIHILKLFIQLGSLFVLFLSLNGIIDIHIVTFKKDYIVPARFMIWWCILLAWAIFALWHFGY